MGIRICVAGATGWTGSAVARGVIAAEDMTLTAAVARKAAGREIGEILELEQPAGVEISASVAEALAGDVDVLIDYTAAGAVKQHALSAIERGIAVVIGTSGLTAEDYAEINQRAQDNNVGVVGGGNFSLTATMMQHLALIAAEHIPQFEVLDYAWADKEDVPSGTARELAEKLGDVQKPERGRPLERLFGPKEARGADINGVQVHSIRMSGFTLRCEAAFGMAGERLTIAHEAGQSAAPYVTGTLLAARAAIGAKGLVRGLDELLFAAR